MNALLNQSDLVELELNEQENISGGVIPPWLWQAFIAEVVYQSINDWDANVAAYKKGLAHQSL